MANLQSFNVNAIMLEISKAAPLLLLTAACGSFFAVGIFAVDYYETLLGKFSNAKAMAILIAVIQELVRFSLLVATVKDFSNGKKFNGWLGLLGSVALVLHDISLAKSIAKTWSIDDAAAYSAIFIFLIVVGFGLEIRLALTVNLKESEVKSEVKLGNLKTSKNGVYTAVKN